MENELFLIRVLLFTDQLNFPKEWPLITQRNRFSKSLPLDLGKTKITPCFHPPLYPFKAASGSPGAPLHPRCSPPPGDSWMFRPSTLLSSSYPCWPREIFRESWRIHHLFVFCFFFSLVWFLFLFVIASVAILEAIPRTMSLHLLSV